MLEYLQIENFALIEELDLSLNRGLTVFTGETGAGKSILLDAIAFLLGARANTLSIRKDKPYMAVSGFFHIKNDQDLKAIIKKHQLEDEEDRNRIHIWRRYNRNGRGQIRINGQPATLTILRECGESLIEINGQHGFQQLFQVKNHLKMLDRLGSEKHHQLLQTYQQRYALWRQLQKDLEILEQRERESIQMLELWQYQNNELTSANLNLEEEEILKREQKRLSNISKNKQSIEKVYQLLTSDQGGSLSILQALNLGQREFVSIVQSDEEFNSASEQWDTCLYTLEELAADFSRSLGSMDEDPYELNRIEERISDLAQLKRKYGNSIAEIMEYHQEIQLKIQASETNEEKLIELRVALKQAQAKMKDAADQLFQSRQKLSEFLSQGVITELADLEMPNTRFKVELYRNEEDLNFNNLGSETCEFLIAANIGEDLKPLVKIASGGELSRIMLALRSIMLQGDIPIVIFDEIDTGISGQTVQRVAEKLAKLSRHCQLLLVTHQPAVAVMGDHHVFIRKTEDAEKTYTLIRELNEREIEEEIKRLIVGASESSGADLLVKELIKRADSYKREMV